MASEFSDTAVRNMVECADMLEQSAPTPQNARSLELTYEWLDKARGAGIDVDTVIAEVRGF